MQQQVPLVMMRPVISTAQSRISIGILFIIVSYYYCHHINACIFWILLL